VGEHVVPQRLPQPLHRFALASERALDEVERASQLEEQRKEARRALFGEAHLHQIAQRVFAERSGERLAALMRLALDVRIELRHVAVIGDVKKRRLKELPILGT